MTLNVVAAACISETADLLEFSNIMISRLYRESSEKEKIFNKQQCSGQKMLC